jgi:hypothetical protein
MCVNAMNSKKVVAWLLIGGQKKTAFPEEIVGEKDYLVIPQAEYHNNEISS